MQSWMGQRMAEEHRRDLTVSTRIGTRWAADSDEPALMAEVDELGGHVPARPSWKGGAPRRSIAPSVGALLIRLGTRLGGASMRTS
jgi:hypothetical protein